MSIDRNILISIRDALHGDRNFILATWLRGLRHGNDWFELIETGAYYKTYHQVIETLLANPKVSVKVACLSDDPDVIVGYVVYSGDRLDWVFVKKAWRHIGIAKSLVPANIKIVSHLTAVGRSILRKFPQVHFNPFNLS